jgi:translation initiation factor 2B subunit (eIF-2B alpha/beta/delta family)
VAEDLESRIDKLAADRTRGASALTREAIDIVAAVSAADRAIVAERLSRLRPAMPAIGAVALEAAGLDDPRRLLGEIETDHDRVTAAAAALLEPAGVVATISDSSLVERVLLAARPRAVQVCVDSPQDEGHNLVGRLRQAGLKVQAAGLAELAADAAVVGSDAVFEDGGFVNRRGTAALVTALAPRATVVVGDRWRRVPGPSPSEWPEPDLFEVVPLAPSLRLVL